MKMLWDGPRGIAARKADVDGDDDANNDGCPPPANPFDKATDGAEQLAALADKMGMDQECKKAMQNAFENSSTSGSASASVDFLMSSGQVSADFASAMAKSLSEQNAEGCQSSIMQLVKSSVAQNATNCMLNNTDTKTTVNASAGASINIFQPSTCQPEDPAVIAATTQLYMNQDNNHMKMIKAAGDDKELIKLEMESYKNLQNSRFKGIKASNVTFKNKVEAIANVKKMTSVQEKSSIKSNMESLANLQAEQDLKSKVGTQGMSDTVRALVNSENSQNVNQAVEQVSKLTERLEISVQGDGRVSMSSCDTILFENVTVGNDVAVQLVSEQITRLARDVGSDTAMKLMASASSKTKMELEAAGLEELAKAMGEANYKIVDASMRALENVSQGEFKEILLKLGTPLIIAATVIVGLIIWKGADFLILPVRMTGGIAREVVRNPIALAVAVGIIVLLVALWTSGAFKFNFGGGKKEEKLQYTYGTVFNVETNAQIGILGKYLKADINDVVQIFYLKTRGKEGVSEELKLRNITKKKLVKLTPSEAQTIMSKIDAMSSTDLRVKVDALLKDDSDPPTSDNDKAFFYS
jgi:hypothetical protein